MAEEQEFVHVYASGQTEGVPGRVTRESFENVWKDRGFVIVDDDEAGAVFSTEAQLLETDTEAGTTRTSRKKG